MDSSNYGVGWRANFFHICTHYAPSCPTRDRPRPVQIGSHDVRDDDGHITPEDDAATCQLLINDSPYSCRYAIILHLIEETTRRRGGGHKHRKEALSFPRRINHRRSVTPATSERARLSRIWGGSGERSVNKNWREGRRHAYTAPLSPLNPVSYSFHRRRSRSGRIWSVGKENTRERRASADR